MCSIVFPLHSKIVRLTRHNSLGRQTSVKMSKEYEGQNPIDIAKQAEQDLNSNAAKTGNVGGSDSTNESGVNEGVTNRFAGAEVTYGSAASGAGNNRDMPEGGINPTTGQPFKAGDFEGEGGPEDKARKLEQDRGGDDAIRGNIRQGGTTNRPGDGRGLG